jgi:hypothetical protein
MTMQLRLVWHHCLGHLQSRRVQDLHKHVLGVPKIPIAAELDTFPVCARVEIRKATSHEVDSR